MSCLSHAAPSLEIPDYSLSRLASNNPPLTVAALQRWLGKEWDGKIYVASSIRLKNKTFVQSGCSPNYWAGWWTLACCKHKMRASGPFKGEISEDNKPTYVFTLTRISDEDRWQVLVSVARVTRYFKTMKEYARFVVTETNKRMARSRLSRELHNDKMHGWRFGDCHANRSGEVGKPCEGHVHQNNWRWDCPEKRSSWNHWILASDEFVLWREPAFKARRVFKQSGSGINIDHNKIVEFIGEIGR
ncbi:MAG: hypothetical protein HY735_05050 [Verrucomicrobia bacterium]|nr:hypothetical protein [Verrucomicrobiota bacterium]